MRELRAALIEAGGSVVLGSSGASYVTGASIVVDGGWSVFKRSS